MTAYKALVFGSNFGYKKYFKILKNIESVKICKIYSTNISKKNTSKNWSKNFVFFNNNVQVRSNDKLGRIDLTKINFKKLFDNKIFNEEKKNYFLAHKICDLIYKKYKKNYHYSK